MLNRSLVLLPAPVAVDVTLKSHAEMAVTAPCSQTFTGELDRPHNQRMQCGSHNLRQGLDSPQSLAYQAGARQRLESLPHQTRSSAARAAAACWAG